jgi:hypothetical protein
MNEPEIYISLASRFLDGGDAAVGPAHELTGFACYHAFESAGGAMVTYRGGHYSFKHAAKLNAFQAYCSGKRFRHAVAALAIKLTALRNAFLYPIPDGTGWIHPMMRLKQKEVRELHRRVSGIVAIIKSEVR